ncbi:hypothetical protein Ciccas_008296 [Cichlidogyrus casuarinus]|uniref:Rhodanese domain-containing protein n=1 Tax=Cichlidogyrus casuarinus TaxID=1844966 RepID=A0ABD2Q1U4_9PLAT
MCFLVYDHISRSVDEGFDSFCEDITELMTHVAKTVYFLKGGFVYFQASYPQLCWTHPRKLPSDSVVASTDRLTTRLMQLFSTFLQDLSSPSLSTNSSSLLRSVSCDMSHTHLK